jgi:hypothetical protein
MLSYDSAVALYELLEEQHDPRSCDVTWIVYLRPSGEE